MSLLTHNLQKAILTGFIQVTAKIISISKYVLVLSVLINNYAGTNIGYVEGGLPPNFHESGLFQVKLVIFVTTQPFSNNQ